MDYKEKYKKYKNLYLIEKSKLLRGGVDKDLQYYKQYYNQDRYPYTQKQQENQVKIGRALETCDTEAERQKKLCYNGPVARDLLFYGDFTEYTNLVNNCREHAENERRQCLAKIENKARDHMRMERMGRNWRQRAYNPNHPLGQKFINNRLRHWNQEDES